MLTSDVYLERMVLHEMLSAEEPLGLAARSYHLLKAFHGHYGLDQLLHSRGVQRREGEVDNPHLGGVAQGPQHLVGGLLTAFPTSLIEEFHEEKEEHPSGTTKPRTTLVLGSLKQIE